MTKTLIALFAATFFSLAAILAPALADEAKLTRTISVSGHGEARAVPDLASISLGVASSADTAQEALAANSATMTKLMALLKTVGVAETDIATSNFSVNPRYDYGTPEKPQPPKVAGYDVTNTVTITARQVAMLGDLLDKAVSAGSNQIYGISFSVSKPDAMLDEARASAMADARRKAEVYAAAGGFALGDIISVAEGGGYQPPMPMLGKAMRAEASADVPIAQGEQTLAVDVNVVWAIK